MITIEKCGEGRCVFCFEDREGVQATFPDGLRGFLCQKHFWQAMRVRMTDPAKTDVPPKGAEIRPPAGKPS